MPFNYWKVFPVVIIWDFVLKCVSSFTASCMNKNRNYPERRPDNFSPRNGQAGTSRSPAKANAIAEMETEPGSSQRLHRGRTRSNGHKTEDEKFQFGIRKKCVLHEGDPTLQPSKAVGSLSWEMQTLALSNLI